MVSAKIISLNTMDYSIIVANMVLFFYMAYSGYSQQTIYKKDVSEISEHGELKAKIHSNKEPKSSNAVKPDADSDQDPKIRELLGLMKQEKPYLNQELTIAELAIQLNLPSHQLSRIIKENTGKNFFVFINDYRLEEFKKLAVNPKNKHISILGLAMEAGFNSKATFNRFFKNATGLTPSEFMESYKF
jgi:AraC-like DNA-binding protein